MWRVRHASNLIAAGISRKHSSAVDVAAFHADGSDTSWGARGQRRVVDAYCAWLEREGWSVRREVDFVDVLAERAAKGEAEQSSTGPLWRGKLPASWLLLFGTREIASAMPRLRPVPPRACGERSVRSRRAHGLANAP